MTPTPRDNTPNPGRSARKPGLAHGLGAFFGHIARGVRTDPKKADNGPHPPTHRASRTHSEAQTTTNDNGDTIHLRRTTIEEIEIRPNPGRPPDSDSDASPPR